MKKCNFCSTLPSHCSTDTSYSSQQKTTSCQQKKNFSLKITLEEFNSIQNSFGSLGMTVKQMADPILGIKTILHRVFIIALYSTLQIRKCSIEGSLYCLV